MLEIIATLIAISLGVLALFTRFGNVWAFARAKLHSYKVSKSLEPDFAKDNIENSVKYYIHPSCQSIDPSGGEDPRAILAVKEKLFSALDRYLIKPTEHPFIFLLADSGMGKTSALINYYIRHRRVWRKPKSRYDMKLMALGRPDTIERITAVNDKSSTVLLLDAFDEDSEAIHNHEQRLYTILNASRDFCRVLISCRTQFFRRDEEIPKETGILKFAPRRAGEPAEYIFHKLYLSPFAEEEAEKYIHRRYRMDLLGGRRKRALALAKKIPDLTARPMLLAHIDDLLKGDRTIKYSFELYDEMINAWLIREESKLRGIKRVDLLEFSERLAVNLFLNRERRKTERIPRDELSVLANQWKIQLDDWKLSTRSLLNRDAEGKYKFAHRSIMEYLLVNRFVNGDETFISKAWTDEMYYFLWEIFRFFSKELNESKVLQGPHWWRYSQYEQQGRSRLIAESLLIGLERIGITVELRDYENIGRMIGEFCLLLLSPSNANDTRVTLFDVSGVSTETHTYLTVYTGVGQAVSDLPLQEWQMGTPRPNVALITDWSQPHFVPRKLEKPSLLYLPAEGASQYLLLIESTSDAEIKEFWNDYGDTLSRILRLMPARPTASNN